jgi:hypothetical protein
MVGKLIAKDWQVYQKQLAGFVAGLVLALALVGMGTPLLAAQPVRCCCWCCCWWSVPTPSSPR